MCSKGALVVGINHYKDAPLTGSVDDANELSYLLAWHDNNDPNFQCKKLVSSVTSVKDDVLKTEIEKIFSNENLETVLFFFSGHGGKLDSGEGYLVTEDSKEKKGGIYMSWLLEKANKSPAKEVIILLDCCYSGSIFDLTENDSLREGISIITACSSDEYSKEKGGKGLFTEAVCGALAGGGSDILGNITSSGVYTYVEDLFSAFEQRPLFRAHLKDTMVLRQSTPYIDKDILRKIDTYFTSPEDEHELSALYEDNKTGLADKTVDKEKEEIFRHLQKMVSCRLVKPVGEEHMYYAAIRDKSCKLTPLGQYYWKRVRKA